ncbi:MAG: hypothetical protein AMJ78_09030 [Omnitrophica WOR_2 bacterium SM23_29]|nr:MAG: hypothetical protein AMJ78_09030 [Omnitrophica WOR_2 bacterium SM23_29]
MVKLKEYKIYTENSPIERLPQPQRVYIPLSQHLGNVTSPIVQVGNQISIGQKIASSDAPVTSPIHASISGKVTAIQNWPHPSLGICKAIVIENDGKGTLATTTFPSPEKIERLTTNEIRTIVREAGIVGMGGAGFPTHIKLTPPKPVDTLIINGVECEPYLTSDYRLMVEKPSEILKGVELIVRCLGIKQVYIAIEDNKPEAIDVFKNKIQGTNYKVQILKSLYPQGGEKQLIKNILKKEVPSGKLPFDIGVLVHNVATVFAIYEAVYKNKPLHERAVTVTGDFLTHPKNLMVPIGTPVKELIEFCKPQRKAARIIVGGPMMGIAQYTEMVPIIKTSGGVILLSDEQVQPYIEDNCIHCGECVRNCPVGLQPCLISLAVERNNWELAKGYSPLDCIECGLCAYLCPAKRNLIQSIKYAKLKTK